VRLTGKAVDSKWPQSRTNPVILPAESKERRWLDANDMEGTYNTLEDYCKLPAF
jgi:hypothetical protein